MRSVPWRGLVALTGAFTLVAACTAACRGEQELRDDCPSAGSACPPCAEDRECVIVSNACHEVAHCTHAGREPPLAVNMIGCNAEYDEPPRDRCGCVGGVCRSR